MDEENWLAVRFEADRERLSRGLPDARLRQRCGSFVHSSTLFANNLIIGSPTLLSEQKRAGITYEGTIAFRSGGGGTGVDKPANQFRVIDPALTKVGEVQRPTAQSAVVGAARGTYPFVSRDIDEQVRTGADVGADEVAAGAAPGPLTPAQVGPDRP